MVDVLRITGPCMEPILPDGSFVTTQAPRFVRAGDVVAIAAAGRVTLHRVVARVGDRIVHQGDRGERAGVARVREVIGRVDAPGRYRRTPSAWRLVLALCARYFF